MKTMGSYIWVPSRWERANGFAVSEEHCRYMVHHKYVGFRQCQRKTTAIIQDYGFCKQHAKKVKVGLELD